jgi:hypothetical protein
MKKKMVLKCELTEHEINELAKEMSERLSQKSILEQEKKDANKKYSREINYYDKKINDSGVIISLGYEEREVDVEIKMNTPDKGSKRITRLDTFESWTEPMNINEYDLFTSMGKDIDAEEDEIKLVNEKTEEE